MIHVVEIHTHQEAKEKIRMTSTQDGARVNKPYTTPIQLSRVNGAYTYNQSLNACYILFFLE